jgi:hypothetical protein
MMMTMTVQFYVHVWEDKQQETQRTWSRQAMVGAVSAVLRLENNKAEETFNVRKI